VMKERIAPLAQLHAIFAQEDIIQLTRHCAPHVLWERILLLVLQNAFRVLMEASAVKRQPANVRSVKQELIPFMVYFVKSVLLELILSREPRMSMNVSVVLPDKYQHLVQLNVQAVFQVFILLKECLVYHVRPGPIQINQEVIFATADHVS